jgi:hypothetical protein
MSDDKLRFYNRFRKPPEIALKQIKAGRLKGFTDINPQWRIQALTELFGPVGTGWYTEIVEARVDEGADRVMVATVIINLYHWAGEGWSRPVTGIGGSLFVASEKSGLRTSDEAFKMAETDAISVACKKLGIAADVYWQHGSKYTAPAETDVHSDGQPKDDNPMPEHFPNEKEMQQGFTQWIAALKKYRKLSTFNEALRENDKQIKADLGGADSPFVLDFREWVVQRREELAE